jgi:ABC-type phosphate/phosphonate transport system permease subunit
LKTNPLSDVLEFLFHGGWTTLVFWILVIGSLGLALLNLLQLGFYSRLSTLILLIYALVLASDWISERVRVSVA